jgi:hypothetical protein
MSHEKAFDPIDVRAVEHTPSRTLLRLYAATITELLRRRVVRTRNAPAGDLAEWLVARAYGGELAPASEKSWDVRSADGRRLQVKCRTVSEVVPRGQRGLSPFRSFDFDAAVIVLLDESSFDVVQAVELPVDAVQASARHVAWVNGYRVHANAALMTAPAASDVTALLRRAMEQVDDPQDDAPPESIVRVPSMAPEAP